MEDPRKLRYAKAQLRRAYVHLIKLKAHRAAGLETQASRLSPIVAAGWIPEADIYNTFRQASLHNGLAGIETPRVIDRLIGEGLEKGKSQPLPADLDDFQDKPLPNVPKDLTGAARVARWKAAHREQYNRYMRHYMAFRAAKKRIAGAS
jgi:hypothetical protein